MRNLLLILAAIITLSIGCNSPSSTSDGKKADAASFQSIDTTKLAKGAVFYQCPMHPEIVSDKPGTCPKCEMELEKREKA